MSQVPRSGLLQTYNQNNPIMPGTFPDAYNLSPMAPTSAYSNNMPPYVNSGLLAPANQPPIITPSGSSSGPSQQNGFYQDATEASRRCQLMPPKAIPQITHSKAMLTMRAHLCSPVIQLHRHSPSRLETIPRPDTHQFHHIQLDKTIQGI